LRETSRPESKKRAGSIEGEKGDVHDPVLCADNLITWFVDIDRTEADLIPQASLHLRFD